MRLLGVGAVAAVVLISCASTVGGGETAMTEIYAGADWYRERPEPEREWRGTLYERNAPLGPAGRPALAYELVTRHGKLPVYAAGVKPKLAPFAGAKVVARGKRVDLTSEGYGPELWIGALRRVAPAHR
jgi:hypothetical protein